MLVDETVVQALTLASNLGLWDVLQVLGAWVPGALTLIAIIYDGLSSVTWPKGILTAVAFLSSPFQNFLTIDDLKNIGPRTTPPVWKLRALIALAFVNSIGWLAFLAYVLMIDEAELAVQALIAPITWV